MLIDINKYVGLTLKEAQIQAAKEGIILQVLRENDQKFDLTTESRPNQVNVELDNGKITEATLN